MTHQTQTQARPSTRPTMPPCGRCGKPSTVVYQAKTEHPVPRCWDHAPALPEAIALGWITPTGVDRRDHLV